MLRSKPMQPLRAHVCNGHLVVGALVFMACSPPPSAGDGSFPLGDSRPTLSSTPDDLTSDVGAAPLTFNVNGNISASDLQAVADGVSLRTYPELQPVSVTTTTHLAETAPTGPMPKTDAAAPPVDVNAYSSYVVVLPTSALTQDQWYVVTVDTLPAAVKPPGLGPLKKESPRYGARFRLGSAPVIRQIDAIQDGTLIVRFSEAVAVDEKTVANLLKVANPDSSECSYVPNGSTTPPPNFGGVSYKCAKAAYSAKSVTVTLSPGLAAPSQAPLAWVDASASTSAALTSTSGQFSATSFPLGCGAGCVTWRPY